MLAIMAQKPATKKAKDKWFLYILQCANGTFYTGITKDPQRRLRMHNEGKASRYTRTRRPVEMIYIESCKNRTEAMIRECAVKSMPRSLKAKMIGPQALKVS
jgi:putative endonuclease